MGSVSDYNDRYITGMQEAHRQYTLRLRDARFVGKASDRELELLQHGLTALSGAIQMLTHADRLADERYE